MHESEKYQPVSIAKAVGVLLFIVGFIFLVEHVHNSFMASRPIPDDELQESVDVASADGPRSGKWPAVMRHYRVDYPWCQFFGCKTVEFRVNVHHRIPVHYAKAAGHPWLELSTRNLITLCGEDHIKFGHAGNFKHFNLDIVNDAKVGKFDSRGISTWPGEKEMLKFLVWSLGPPRDTEPDELPLVMTDPHKAWKLWKAR